MVEQNASRENRSSIEIHRHKDGTYSWTITMFQAEGMSLDTMVAEIDRADATLNLQYSWRRSP